MVGSARNGVRCGPLLLVVGLFSTQLFAASAEYLSGDKVPGLLVHGATGADCTDTIWAIPTAATVDLVASTLELTGPMVEPDDDCAPSHFALSQDRALSRLNRGAVATEFIAPLEQPYVVGVKFHVLNVGELTDAEALVLFDQIDTYVADAHSIFAPASLGILVSVNNHINPEVDAAGVQAAIDLIPAVLSNTLHPNVLLAELSALSGDSHSKGQINVYLFDGEQVATSTAIASSFRAFFAKKGIVADDFIVINWQAASTSSFAHELGHALSLGHVNFIAADGLMYCYAYNPETWDGLCDYTDDNLMWIEGEADRTRLIPAQVLRAAFNSTSFINRAERIGGKPEAPLDCPDSEISQSCPFLGALP